MNTMLENSLRRLFAELEFSDREPGLRSDAHWMVSVTRWDDDAEPGCFHALFHAMSRPGNEETAEGFAFEVVGEMAVVKSVTLNGRGQGWARNLAAGEYFVKVAAEKIVAVNFESELALAAHGMAHSRSTAQLQERTALHREDSPCHAWLERRTRAGTDETWLYFETADERLSDREFTILVGETSHAVRLTPTSDGYAIASIRLDLPYAEAARLLPAGSFFQSAE